MRGYPLRQQKRRAILYTPKMCIAREHVRNIVGHAICRPTIGGEVDLLKDHDAIGESNSGNHAHQSGDDDMFIAMNRFQVKTGQEKAFEHIWASRESYLSELPGFIEFHLLKGPVHDDHTLYSSHTTWADKAHFVAWTTSEQFRRAHARAGNDSAGPSLYLGHPKFEGFEVIQSERNTKGAAP